MRAATLLIQDNFYCVNKSVNVALTVENCAVSFNVRSLRRHFMPC